MSSATADIATTIFDLHRMLGTLTQALVFTLGRPYASLSDAAVYHLRVEAIDVQRRIERLHGTLKPYLERRLADPDQDPQGSPMATAFPALRKS